MTQLLAAERGLTVDVGGFQVEMEKQRSRGRAALKKEVLVAATEGDSAVEHAPTCFVGYSLTPSAGVHARVVDLVSSGKDLFLVFDQTPFYAEMGGQAGDSGSALISGALVSIVDTVKDKAGRHLHKVADGSPAVAVGSNAELSVDLARRRAISRHHSATHLLHWALRKVLGTHIRQAGTHKTRTGCVSISRISRPSRLPSSRRSRAS